MNTYKVVSTTVINKGADGKSYAEGEPFPYDPEDRMHVAWLQQGRLRIELIETAVKKPAVKNGK